MTSESLHLLRIFIDIEARDSRQAYSGVLLDRAITLEIASAAVLRVIDSYGNSAIVHGAPATDLAQTSTSLSNWSIARPSCAHFWRRSTKATTSDW